MCQVQKTAKHPRYTINYEYVPNEEAMRAAVAIVLRAIGVLPGDPLDVPVPLTKAPVRQESEAKEGAACLAEVR